MLGHVADVAEEGRRRLALADELSFTLLMYEIYNYRCAVTRAQFRESAILPHPDLEVFFFRPLSEGGLLSFRNAIVVEKAVASLIRLGIVAIGQDYSVLAWNGRTWSGALSLWLHPEEAYWPDPLLLHPQKKNIVRPE